MKPFDITRIPEYFAIAGFILWALIERWFQMSGQQQVGGQQKDQGTYWLITMSWYAAMITSFVDAFYFHWTPQGLAIRELRWAGIPLITIGLAARILARRALGRHYSVRVETSESHQLITQGIYGKLRHPAYFGSLNLFIGIPLSSWSILGLGIALIGGIPAILYRTRIEEEVLSERFGQEYSEYAKGTWRIFPYIW
jgi:protein-S-isoprenylcysteine O-methyltransferase Ste14